MAFDRKSMEQVVQSMINWTQGTTTKLSDFRVGSRNRTILEALGKEIEELYDKAYRSIKTLIEQNIYTVLGFPKRPATYSTGTVTLGRTTAADQDYLIPLGTILRTKATATQGPINFRTTADALLAQGTTSIDVSVVCTVAGTLGNVEAATIVDFQTKPSGVDTVTNASAFNNALDEETPDQQKTRFQSFIASLTRGTLASIEYGATTAQLTLTDGTVTERVVDAKAFEDLTNSLGVVSCYIWNGTDGASADLIAQANTVILGYTDTTGKFIYGYKPAGIQVNLYAATMKPVTIKLTVTPDVGVVLDDIKPYIEQEIGDYFAALKQGGTLYQTALETRVELVQGVQDVKLELSTDGGVTYSDSNVTAGDTEIVTPQTPYIYA